MKEFMLYRVYMFFLGAGSYLLWLTVISFIFLISPLLLSNVFVFSLVIILLLAGGIYWVIFKDKLRQQIKDNIIMNFIASYCERKGFSYLNNVYLKSNENTVVTSNIDHIVITKKGVALIEVNTEEIINKNSDYDAKLSLIAENDEMKKYINVLNDPFMNNANNIEVLKKLLDKDIQYYNIVLYMYKNKMPKFTEKKNFCKIGYIDDLNDIIQEFDLLSQKVVTNDDVIEISGLIQEADENSEYLFDENDDSDDNDDEEE